MTIEFMPNGVNCSAHLLYRIIHAKHLRPNEEYTRAIWCEEHCEGRTYVNEWAALFELESDAVLYAIRWS